MHTKRNEDPYLVRVLEPRRKTPHTQRCNEFSKSPIAFHSFFAVVVSRLQYFTCVPRRLAQALKEAAAREQEQAAKAAGGGRSSFQV